MLRLPRALGHIAFVVAMAAGVGLRRSQMLAPAIRLIRWAALACPWIFACGNAAALTYTIDFESVPALSSLTGGINSFSYGGSFVLISEGGVVQNPGYGGDTSHLFATSNDCAGCTANLFVNFSTPVSDVSLDIDTFSSPFSPAVGTYSLVDNDNGHIASAAITSFGRATLSLPFENMGGGFSVIAPAYVNQGELSWAYGIDNLTFSVPAPVPEPRTYAMLVAGLGLLIFAARRRTQGSA